MGGGGSWGGGFLFAAAVFLDSLLGLESTATEARMGDAGRFARTAAPHILHSTAVHSFSAKVQALHCQRLRKKDAMVRVVCAVVIKHLVIFPRSLTQVRQYLPN